MLEGLLDSLARLVETSPWLAPFAAFAGGLLTAASPCVIVMVPLMVAYVAGQGTRTVGRSFLLSLTFSIGLTTMFLVMFLVTVAVSSVLKATWWTYVAAAVFLLMGLHLLGVITWQPPAPKAVTPKQKGFIGAFLLGLLSGLVSLPCAGPVLATVLAVIPLKGHGFGALLLVAYSLGHCGLILVGGTSMGVVQRMADSRGWNRSVDVLRRVAGVIIILVGAALLLS